MNVVNIMGRLVKNPEVRVTQTQMEVATFTVAVDRNLTRDKKEQAQANGMPTADFIRCIAFGRIAETIGKYIVKGNRITLNGHIQTGSYTDKDGRKVFTTDVIVDRFDFIDSVNSQQQQNSQQNYQQRPVNNQQSYQQYQQQPQQSYQQPQQMSVDDEIPDGFTMINEEDIPF